MSNRQAGAFAKLNRHIAVIGVALATLSLPTVSFALGTDDERNACTPDVFRLCNEEIPNVDGIIACLKSKKAQLSTPCKLVFDRDPSRSQRASK